MKKTHQYIRNIFYGLLTIFFLGFNTISVRGVPMGGAGSGLENPLRGNANTIPDLLMLIIEQFVVPIGGVIVVFMFIYSGFLFVTAQGNSEKLQKAKDSFIYTIIGAALVLGAFAISSIIQNTVEQIKTAL